MGRDMIARLRRSSALAALAALAAFAALMLSACESKGVNTIYEIRADELSCALSVAPEWWASAPFPGADGELDPDCEWLRFPGLSLLEIEHGLGRAPSQISLYISFEPNGVSSTISSGDSGRIVGADERYVVVENFTEQEFFLRIELR